LTETGSVGKVQRSRVGKIRSVGDVEYFGAKFSVEPLGQVEALEERKINPAVRRSAHLGWTAPQRGEAGLAGRGNRAWIAEGGSIYKVSDAAVLIRADAGNKIGIAA
jgi:hypothetical protein